MISSKSRSFLIIGAVLLILLIPLVAMLFTDEINWSAFDFLVAAILLFGAGFLLEIILRFIKQNTHRIILIFVLLAVLFLIWAELAVGLFGSPVAGN